ncbi:hypothetical protein F5888DRAFT_1861437 [Russula emetica]|nr:hypothetical protein F5888DRAFT_1861437 [Russula emetica]
MHAFFSPGLLNFGSPLPALRRPEKAKGVLNKARKAVPTSHDIWIAAGRLIEQEAYAAELSEEKRIERVDKTLATAVRTLPIESATVAMDVDEEDRFTTWLGDTEAAEARGRVGTARAVLAFTLRVFPDCRDLWRRAADLEKAHGTHESLDKLLARAVECCPQAEVQYYGLCGPRRSGSVVGLPQFGSEPKFEPELFRT